MNGDEETYGSLCKQRIHILTHAHTDSEAGCECRRHFASHTLNQLMEAHDVRTTILTSFVYIDCKNQAVDHSNFFFFI